MTLKPVTLKLARSLWAQRPQHYGDPSDQTPWQNTPELGLAPRGTFPCTHLS